MKYCSKCGNELMDEAVICPKCGCAVEGSNFQLSQPVKEKRKKINTNILNEFIAVAPWLISGLFTLIISFVVHEIAEIYHGDFSYDMESILYDVTEHAGINASWACDFIGGILLVIGVVVFFRNRKKQQDLSKKKISVSLSLLLICPAILSCIVLFTYDYINYRPYVQDIYTKDEVELCISDIFKGVEFNDEFADETYGLYFDYMTAYNQLCRDGDMVIFKNGCIKLADKYENLLTNPEEYINENKYNLDCFELDVRSLTCSLALSDDEYSGFVENSYESVGSFISMVYKTKEDDFNNYLLMEETANKWYDANRVWIVLYELSHNAGKIYNGVEYFRVEEQEPKGYLINCYLEDNIYGLELDISLDSFVNGNIIKGTTVSPGSNYSIWYDPYMNKICFNAIWRYTTGEISHGYCRFDLREIID